MAQGFQITNPRMRFFDVNGAVLAFGKVYFYIAGSSTPQNTWSNSDLSSLNTNPVILSASGECTIFVPSATLYKVDLYSSTNVHQSGWPVDGVEAIPAPAPPAPTPSPVPTGGIIAYGGASAPTGYLICNGALISRVTYADLFTAIGTAYGAGDASTTFGIPDLRGAFPLGTAASGTGSTLGDTGGSLDHTHTGPSHTHTAATGDLTHSHAMTVAAHTHTVTVPRDGWGAAATNVSGRVVTLPVASDTMLQATTDQVLTSGSGGAISQNSGDALAGTQGVTVAAGGTGLTGTANGPFTTVNFLIKT